jgi:hypothetical protein
MAIWCDSKSTEYQVLGSGFLLQIDVLLYRIFDNWKLLKDLMIAICKSHQHQSVKLQNAILDFLFLVEERYFIAPIDTQEGSPKKLKRNQEAYLEILECIGQQAPTLSWCYQERLLHYLSFLLHAGKLLPPSQKICKHLLDCATSDIAAIRYGAVICLQQLLHNIKISRPRTVYKNKLFIDYIEDDVYQESTALLPIPNSELEWEKAPYCDWCYYGWNGKTSEYFHYVPLSSDEHLTREKLHAGDLSLEEYQTLTTQAQVSSDEEIYHCRKMLAEYFSNPQFWNDFTANFGNDERSADMTEVYTKFFQL